MALVLSAPGRDGRSHTSKRDALNPPCLVISTPAQSRALRQSSLKHNSLPSCQNYCYEGLLSDVPRDGLCACADCHLLYVVWFSVSVCIDLRAGGEAEVTLIGVRWGEGIAESWHSISWEKRTPNKEEYVKDRRRRRGDMTVIKRRERTAGLLREAIVWRRRPRSCSYITCLTFWQPHPHPSTHPLSLRFFRQVSLTIKLLLLLMCPFTSEASTQMKPSCFIIAR